MKKNLFFLAFFAGLLMGCSKQFSNELEADLKSTPSSLVVGFDEIETRVQLQNGKTVWTKGDQVSVFYLSNANQKWEYNGETGSRIAQLKCKDIGSATNDLNKVVVVYPYNSNYYINPETCDIKASMPAEQTYMQNSYGLDGNIMISAGYYNQFSLKNVCGWLELKVTGNGEKIKSIKFAGNNDEQVAGEIYINSTDATATLASEMGEITENEGEDVTGGTGGCLIFEDTILKEITLNCGNGVILSGNPTSFYVALPPQVFANGFTIQIEDIYGNTMTKTTDKEVVVQRNRILPMTAFQFTIPQAPVTPTIANNKILYTSSNGHIINPKDLNAFGSAIISNTYTDDIGVLVFEKDLTSIGDNAFYYCNTLQTITLPDSITEIGNNAFMECGYLKEVTLPKNLVTIGRQSFRNCWNLESIVIPDGVKSIGEYAFHIASDLKEVTLPDNIEIIGEGAFSGCTSLTKFISQKATRDQRCVIINNELVAFAPCGIVAYAIPSNVKSIAGMTFYSAWELTDIYIPNSVTSIGNGAFQFCGLTSLNIPSGVETINEYAFESCTELKDLTISEGVKRIRHDAFSWCENLTSVTIPNSMEEIESNPFRCCERLFEFNGKLSSDNGRLLVVDDRIVSFAPYGIIGYSIPDGIRTIGNESFRGLSNIMSITIPESVELMEAAAFCDCTNLQSVYCESETPPTSEVWMFNNNAENRKIYVPRGSAEVYKCAEYWSDYKDDIEEYDM